MDDNLEAKRRLIEALRKLADRLEMSSVEEMPRVLADVGMEQGLSAKLHVNPMDEAEARSILEHQLAPFRQMHYSELAARVGDENVVALPVVGASGVEYNVEIQFLWDDVRHNTGNVRVIGSIDNGCAPSA